MKQFDFSAIHGNHTDYIKAVQSGIYQYITSIDIMSTDVLYGFDPINGAVKIFPSIRPLTAVKTDRFADAIRKSWYNREYKALTSLKADVEKAYADTDDKASVDTEYALLIKRIAVALALMGETHSTGRTVECIVSAYRKDGIYPDCEAEAEALKTIAAKGDSEATKRALITFVKAFWLENPDDGIMHYGCNVSAGMIRSVESVAYGRHVFKDGYSVQRFGTRKNVAAECIMAIIAVLQDRRDKALTTEPTTTEPTTKGKSTKRGKK